MRATYLINPRNEELETVETFAKRVYETSKRVSKSKQTIELNREETVSVIVRLSKYYKESYKDILEAIGCVQSSKRYRVFFYNCLGQLLLNVEKR